VIARQRLMLLLGGGLAAGIAIGAAWPPPPIPKTSGQEGEWVLPDAATLERFSADAFASASKGLKWEGAAATEEAARKSWRLAGFLYGADTFALIESEGAARRAQQAKPGDALPDGSRLAGIERDTITTELDGCRQVYQLYRPKPISRSDACDTSAGDAEPRKSP